MTINDKGFWERIREEKVTLKELPYLLLTIVLISPFLPIVLMEEIFK